jgi:uncharacterized phage protein (TIGR01671 family)
MREILYRGKRKDSGEWVYGYYVISDNKSYMFTGKTGLSQVTPAHRLMYMDFERHDVNPETVGQYTGLTDKNDVKIFEGDIVKGQGNIYIIKYTKILCAFEMYKLNKKLRLNASHLIVSLVMGNIHDNPELLEKIL